jgi:hypothetical protein
MTWAKIDDRLHSHPKARKAGLEAMGLWVLCLSFCGAYNTDGHIARADVEAIGGRRALALAVKLVEAGLWTAGNGGWSFHDFLVYNPSAEKVAAERARKAEAGRAGGRASGRSRSASRAVANGGSGSTDEARASPPASGTDELPTRPDPDPDPAATAAGGVGGAPGLGDVISAAQVLAEDGVDVAKSVLDRYARGLRPTPKQIQTVKRAWEERQATEDAIRGFSNPAGDEEPEPTQAVPQRRAKPPPSPLDHWLAEHPEDQE